MKNLFLAPVTLIFGFNGSKSKGFLELLTQAYQVWIVSIYPFVVIGNQIVDTTRQTNCRVQLCCNSAKICLFLGVGDRYFAYEILLATDNNQNGDLSSTIHILTCPIYIFFSIDSSEAREKYVEYYLSNMRTINYVLDRTHFQGLGWVVPFNVREYVHFCNCLLYFLPFKAITV